MLDPIAIAIPLFFVAIGVELLIGRLGWGKVEYHVPTAFADLSCGITQQVMNFVAKAWLIVPYAALDAWTPLEWTGLWGHLLAFLGVDATYYAWHRFTHECRLGWVTHAVHHQSEDYNLAVALRQTLTSSLSGVPFYLPLAVLGVPTEMFLLHTALNTLYQFWIHTEAIGRLGPLEWVLNTPSHHRVHHGVNPHYLDTNYAGVLIVWDRLFGTFQEEDVAPVYGTVRPLRSRNPFVANAVPFIDLWREMVAAPSALDAVKHALRGPSTPSPWVDKEAADLGRVKYVPAVPSWRTILAMLSFPAVALVVLGLVGWGATWPQAWAWAAVVGIAAATVGWSGLLSGQATDPSS